MVKWTWSLRFFAVFLATGLTLLAMGAVALALYAFSSGSLLIGTAVVLAEVCIGSLLTWAIAEMYEES